MPLCLHVCMSVSMFAQMIMLMMNNKVYSSPIIFLFAGNTEVTRLFEGEPDHLVPSTSQFLLESDIFLMAGRMIGHSFLHGGPCLSGISPAIIHVLFGGTPETATIQLEDCPDLDLRSTIQLV